MNDFARFAIDEQRTEAPLLDRVDRRIFEHLSLRMFEHGQLFHAPVFSDDVANDHLIFVSANASPLGVLGIVLPLEEIASRLVTSH